MPAVHPTPGLPFLLNQDYRALLYTRCTLVTLIRPTWSRVSPSAYSGTSCPCSFSFLPQPVAIWSRGGRRRQATTFLIWHVQVTEEEREQDAQRATVSRRCVALDLSELSWAPIGREPVPGRYHSSLWSVLLLPLLLTEGPFSSQEA